MITLTSFADGLARDERLFDGGRWSGARWAPQQAQRWPVAAWAQPLYPSGQAIKLRDFGVDPLPKYRDYMLGLYRERWSDIRDWLYQYGGTSTLIACWCPRTRTAREQIKRFGSFHCHLGVVAEVLDSTEFEWVFGPAHEKGMVR